jgi:hypothetical protein
MATDDGEFDPEFDFDDVRASNFEQPALPKLSGAPIAHHGCCLGLSTPLLAVLHTLLSSSRSRVLSIGSGYGLLEALLLTLLPSLDLVGTEVQPSPNVYLPPDHHRTVAGTRFLDPSAKEAGAWLFVYPKRVGLVDEYIDTYGNGHVETVIWAGPKADWADYRGCFEEQRHGIQWDVEIKSADEIGGRAWELIAVARKKI